jgi:transcriptional regulator with XRE-family HTH domain
MNDNRGNLGKIIKQQRVAESLTLKDLATMAGISSSHLGRIERDERFPSARILRKIAGPLGFEEGELFTLAGYLSPQHSSMADVGVSYTIEKVDPYVSRMLAQESIEVQRALIGILTILKSISRSLSRENV